MDLLTSVVASPFPLGLSLIPLSWKHPRNESDVGRYLLPNMRSDESGCSDKQRIINRGLLRDIESQRTFQELEDKKKEVVINLNTNGLFSPPRRHPRTISLNAPILNLSSYPPPLGAKEGTKGQSANNR
ncbi:hypothetical protein CDAR_212661 [Caerostris darwini]|uniref:Uncharacterized protein n=1 Tax=Caerostris darwini TaxID=1538125 RepID=A0AAV4Q0B3_9ARAC|nr:hypothetical protein CDAR_212661 [Caerostris darwini]